MVSALSRERAAKLDQEDGLASFRQQFVIEDPDLIYLDGNSLGRPPLTVAKRMQEAVEVEWATQLIGAWNSGWWEAPTRIGAMLAPLLGTDADEVIVGDQTSLNLFKLATAALQLRPGRPRIVTDTLNFPSDLYVLQGITHMLGDRHEIIRVGSLDDGVTPDLEALTSAIDEKTALVTLSHVAFKSGYLYEMRHITEMSHRVGALVLWDLSHSAGAVPIALDECEADFAVGCTYKYLNGGPGAPAFLYVNRSLHQDALSPIWGWWGEAQPFAFAQEYQPAPGILRFLSGTAPMLSMIALEESLRPVLAAGIEPLRQKSIALTEYAIELADAQLLPLGFRLGSPRESERRGSHVSLRHPEGYRINRALIGEMKVVPDFREPDNLRLGFAPLYVSFKDAWEAIERLRRVVLERRFEKYPFQRLLVT